MKKLTILLLVVIAILAAGCSSKNSSLEADKTSASANYVVAKANFTEKAIKIDYPQIIQLGDSNQQQKINDLLKNEALAILNDYKDERSELSLDISYVTKYQSPNILSIEYLGDFNLTGAAHPSNVIYTSNIDLKKASSIKLGDFLDINSDVALKYKAGKYQPWSPDLDLDKLGVLAEIKSNLTSDDLIEQLQQQPSKFYFTQDSLGISVEVPHAAGDHLELEVSYQDLSLWIKLGNAVWQEFMKD